MKIIKELSISKMDNSTASTSDLENKKQELLVRMNTQIEKNKKLLREKEENNFNDIMKTIEKFFLEKEKELELERIAYSYEHR